MWWCLIFTYDKSIQRPDKVSIDENRSYEFEIKDLSKHYDEVFGNDKKFRKFFVRSTFQMLLRSNQNTVLILAGSLASIPVNILTGFYESSSYKCAEWAIHILQLCISISFYIFYLSFVRSFIYIREQGERYANIVFDKERHNSRKEIEQAVYNIQYFSCMEKYKSVRISICGCLVFGIILTLLLLIPPDYIVELIQFCIINFKNAFGGTHVNTFYGKN